MKKRDKKAIVSDYLGWIILGVAILAIMFIAFFYLKQSGASLLDKIKGLLFGR